MDALFTSYFDAILVVTVASCYQVFGPKPCGFVIFGPKLDKFGDATKLQLEGINAKNCHGKHELLGF